MGFEMGHLLKWVTLAKIIALGDFQIVEVEFFLRTNWTRIYMTEQDVVVIERNWEKFRRKWSLIKVTKCILSLEFCVCSIE